MAVIHPVFLVLQVIGATWYLWALERQYDCWRMECIKEMNSRFSRCRPIFLDCSSLDWPDRQRWLNATSAIQRCDALTDSNHQRFGIFAAAFTNEVASARFIEKYFYCLWWGLRNLRFELLLPTILWPDVPNVFASFSFDLY